MEKSNNNKRVNEIIFKFTRQKAHIKLFKKYSSSQFSYNTICINHIIFNKPCLVVAKFKDYLVYDDDAEFITNFYPIDNCFLKLKKILNLYEIYSKVFPNYLVIKERKYMYRNIRKKQKMIDAFNKIWTEEEENRKKIYKEEKILDDNKVFTNYVKEEIRLFQKEASFRKYKNSFDSESRKEGSLPWNSSISISLLNKNTLNNFNDTIFFKGKSIESFLSNENNETLSNIINIMSDNKIYVKDLHNILRINTYSKYSHILNENNNRSKYNLKDKKKNNGFIKKIHFNNDILKNNIKTPLKKEEKTKKDKDKNNIISSSLTKKVNIPLISCNSNPNLEKPNSSRHNIFLSSLGETIININNNYFHRPIHTTRDEQHKSNFNDNLNKKNFKSIEDINKENNKKRHLYLTNNKDVKTVNSKLFKRFKNKHSSQDFSYKKKFDNNYFNNFNNYTYTKKRKLTPQFTLGNNKKEIINGILNGNKMTKNTNNKSNNNYHFIKLNLKSKNNISRIRNNLIKNKDFIKKNILKKIEKTKENLKDNKILKKNHRKLESKSKFNISEYLLTFISKLKTESDVANKTFQKNKDNKNLKLNFINTSKNQLSEEKILTSISRSKEKDKIKLSNQIRNLISGKQTKTNLKFNHRKISSNIFPIIKNVSKPKSKEHKDFKYIDTYTTINSKNNNILFSSYRKNNESTDNQGNGFSNHKRLFFKINSNKKKYIISPLNSLNNIKNRNNNIKAKKLFNIINQKKISNELKRKNQINLKNKYKNFINKKKIKKSCDLNQEIHKKCKKNILNKINTDTNNFYSSIFESNSNSIDFNYNACSHNNQLNSNIDNLKKKNNIELAQISVQERKTTENHRLFKKIIALKIENLKKRKDNKIIKNNIIKNDNNLNLAIKVNTTNFLSKYKGK